MSAEKRFCSSILGFMILAAMRFWHSCIFLSLLTLGNLGAQTIELSELVDEVRENLKFFEGANDMQFDVQIDPCPDFVTDLFRLRIVLSNLMSNAMKYQRLEVHEHRVGIQVLCKEDSVELVVEYSGTGIAEDQQALVFNMFHRVDDKKSGSGIGLYIVKEALEKLSGSIELLSVPDQGTTFTCSIPNLKK